MALSSDSEDSISREVNYRNLKNAWDEEPELNLSDSVKSQISAKRQKKSSSATKVCLGFKNRIKLRKKLTQHLEDGTMNNFEVKQIGDHTRSPEETYSAKPHAVTFENIQRTDLESAKEKSSTSSCASSSASYSSSSSDGRRDHQKKTNNSKSKIPSEKKPERTIALNRKQKSPLREKSGVSSKNLEITSKKRGKLRESVIEKEKNSSEGSTVSTVESSRRPSKENMAQMSNVPSSMVNGKMVFMDESQLKARLKELEQRRGGSKPVEVKKQETVKKMHKKENKKNTVAIAPGELRKTRYYLEKCISTVKDIGMVLNDGIEPPDGSEDYTRRKNRTQEFASRFCRVYMYSLITQLANMASVSGPLDLSKFTSMYQSMSAALLSFLSHIPSTVGTLAYQKLKDYLAGIDKVCEKNLNWLDKDGNYDNLEYISALKEQCSRLLQKLEENYLAVPPADSLLKSESTRTTLGTDCRRINKNGLNEANKAMNLHKRFSMYNSVAYRSCRKWRNMPDAYEGRKPKVKSRYRTATFKHRPPADKQQSQTLFQQQHKNLRYDERTADSLLQTSTVATPINEDNIKTMVQYEDEKRKNSAENDDAEYRIKEDPLMEEDEEESREGTALQKVKKESKGTTIIIEEQQCQNACEGNHHHRASRSHDEDILAKLFQLLQNKKNEEDNETLMNTIRQLQQCLHIKNQNTELLNGKTPGKVAQRTLSAQNTNMVIVNKQSTKKQKKDPIVTVTGAKNAQLICIRDDNSIASTYSEEPDKHSERQNQKYTRNRAGKILISAEVQTCSSQPSVNVDDEDNDHRYHQIQQFRQVHTGTKSSIRRVNRPRRMLGLLPSQFAINVIDYKLSFTKHHKGNYQYRNTTGMKPWELMSKISDEILQYALSGVTQEMETNALLENIYESEFVY